LHFVPKGNDPTQQYAMHFTHGRLSLKLLAINGEGSSVRLCSAA
jgi:hypothetical protein